MSCVQPPVRNLCSRGEPEMLKWTTSLLAASLCLMLSAASARTQDLTDEGYYRVADSQAFSTVPITCNEPFCTHYTANGGVVDTSDYAVGQNVYVNASNLPSGQLYSSSAEWDQESIQRDIHLELELRSRGWLLDVELRREHVFEHFVRLSSRLCRAAELPTVTRRVWVGHTDLLRQHPRNLSHVRLQTQS